MSIAEVLGQAWRNQGEYNYNIGIRLVDGAGAAVPVTGDVKILFEAPNGGEGELAGSIGTGDDTNVAYYTVTASDFQIVGTYLFWVQIGAVEIYGPFELEIFEV